MTPFSHDNNADDDAKARAIPQVFSGNSQAKIIVRKAESTGALFNLPAYTKNFLNPI